MFCQILLIPVLDGYKCIKITFTPGLLLDQVADTGMVKADMIQFENSILNHCWLECGRKRYICKINSRHFRFFICLDIFNGKYYCLCTGVVFTYKQKEIAFIKIDVRPVKVDLLYFHRLHIYIWQCN